MFLATGIDLVETKRFVTWSSYEETKLLRIFSKIELLNSIQKNNNKYKFFPEKLAVRFAAKEAFYKALSSILIQLNQTKHKFYLIESCPNIVVVKKTWGVPELEINWSFFEKKTQTKLVVFKTSLSLSHEQNMVVAHVIIWG